MRCTVCAAEGFTPTLERHCVNSLSMKYIDSPLPEGSSEAKVLPPRETKASVKADFLASLLGKDDK